MIELNYLNAFSISLVGTSLIFCVRIFHKIRTKKCKCFPKIRKTVVITGATSGLGEACAMELAKRNCRLILGCRNIKLGEEIVNKIRKSNESADVKMLWLELTDLESIKKFASHLENERIDILINNAGVMAGHFRMIPSTKTEEDMTVNYLGHFYLTNLLLPNLGDGSADPNIDGDSPTRSKVSSRVIFISSSLSKNGRLVIENLDLSKDPYNPIQAYANSKLALNIFATELHRRYHSLDKFKRNINVMTVFTNGMVNTRLGRHVVSTYNVLVQPLIKLCFYLLLRDSSDVCHSIVHCAMNEDLNESSNELFANFQSIPWPNNMTESVKVSSKLWDKSLEIVGLR